MYSELLLVTTVVLSRGKISMRPKFNAAHTNPQGFRTDVRCSKRELANAYGISEQHAQRLISRFGSSAPDIDMLLAARNRPRCHRDQDTDRTSEDVAFG